MKSSLNFKATLLSLLIGISFTHITSQSYNPMAVEGATWFMEYSNDDNEAWTYYAYRIQGDELIDGINYKKLYYIPARDFQFLPDFHPEWNIVIGYMRDDTLAKKVYIRNFAFENDVSFLCPSQEDEFLLYDFSKTVGDTILRCGMADGLVVTDSEGTFYNYERRYLDGGFDKAVEGIGYLRDIFDTGVIIAGYGSRLVHYCIGEFDECYFGIPTSTFDIEHQRVKVYPNPANDKLWIENTGSNTDATINIYNINNQLVESIKSPSKGITTINIDFLESGIYIIEIGVDKTLFVKN